MYRIFLIYLITMHCGICVADFLPSLFWHPQNPLFACEDPTLRVQRKDLLNVFCPHKENNPKTTSYTDPTYENMYYVKTEEEYNTCNSTKGFRMLLCDNTPLSPTPKCRLADCIGQTVLTFVPAAIANQPEYREGETIYFISTGFRTPENLLKRVGGSCSKINKPGEYKMRMKIYVCTKNEVKAGLCERYPTVGSYSSGCVTNYTAWVKNMSLIYQNSQGKCFVQETRDKIDVLIGSKSIEQRNAEIVCPPPKCNLPWMTTEDKDIYINQKCYKEQSQTCTNQINGNVTINKRNVLVACPQKLCLEPKSEYEKFYQIQRQCFIPTSTTCLLPWLNITVKEYKDVQVECSNASRIISDLSKNKNDAEAQDERNLFIIIATFSSIISFIMGSLLGTICMKYRQKKKLNKPIGFPVPVLATNEYINKSGIPDYADSPYYFVDGVAVLGTTPEKGSPEEERKTEISSVTRSVSFNHIDNKQYTPYQPSTLPRNGHHPKVSRAPSTTSQVLLLRHVSDAGNFHKRLTSTNSDTTPIQKIRLYSTSEKAAAVHEV